MPSCNIAIIGGGIVGVAIARELAERFPHITLFEKEKGLAHHASGRNSGVLHSGINPRPGTLKAQLCVEGNRVLRQYCHEHGIPHEIGGTLVMARDESEIPRLVALKERAEANRVPNIEILSPEQFRAHEPNAIGVAALYSPTGAIVDSVALTQALGREAKDRGVRLVFHETIHGLEETAACVRLKGPKEDYQADLVIDCAGSQADRLAHSVGVAQDYTIVPFRGEYVVVPAAESPVVRSMIYPIPDLRFPFLGVHITKTVSGDILIGPNAVLAMGRESYGRYQISPRDLYEMLCHKGFWKAVLHNSALSSVVWKELKSSFHQPYFLQQAADLIKGLNVSQRVLGRRAGIRAQLIHSNGELVDDLVIETTPRSIHLLNVVSPGMTSSLAFAKWFSQKLDNQGKWTA